MNAVSMLRPEVFEKAAEWIAGPLNTCCPAITRALPYADLFVKLKYLAAFESVFKPERCDDPPYWWKFKDSESRILALLLMAEIIRSEGRPVKPKSRRATPRTRRA